ncbi:related to CDC123 - protein controls the cell cycle by controlling eIF2gamma abundance [Melanopsichium pennsylvanicum]|uniref:Related to CDC123 - protein controls the cell cycle by controlling eIF2gamma abundance n=2 Tax=Melanopsichium pennsylvanicum TaxID=63383 RepID=A0AAJ4XQW6_9BASI|nr:related to CDC123-protein controls the cell cycle by controlling eIF2gamma abundance [Melanopsichium pennsylvanicum 4]SNX87549.1 related to CDC123 - protein controls the cell cycle by controlling eIF2gamma abundance [Melanopsichium pennsylvanicum]
MSEEWITCDPLTPPLEALYWTQYSQWYSIFRNNAPKSTLIDIDTVQPELLDWLVSDTFVLPQDSAVSSQRRRGSQSSSSDSWGSSRSNPAPLNSNNDPLNSNNDSEQYNEAHVFEAKVKRSAMQNNEIDNDLESEDDEEQTVWRLDKLDQKIREVVEKYDGGPIFPKLNWSAPQDAAFMLPGNSCQCMLPEDVYLLLKSSEFVGRDLEQISHIELDHDGHSSSLELTVRDDEKGGQGEGLNISTAEPQSKTDDAHATIRKAGDTSGGDERRLIRPQLILKKWFQMAKSHEFRCFVRSSCLIAISQRDVTYYDHLQDPHTQAKIRSNIYDFWSCAIAAKASTGEWSLRDYVFDVYLTKDLGRCWIIDFGAWLPRTDPLLFSYDELEVLHKQEKRLRKRKAEQEQQQQDDPVMVRIKIKSSQTRTELQQSQTADNNHNQDDHTDKEDDNDQEAWGKSDVELRVLSDRRMASSGGTGATYSSNMVPKDLVEFARASGRVGGGGAASSHSMSVDQIVDRWNAQVDLEEGTSL